MTRNWEGRGEGQGGVKNLIKDISQTEGLEDSASPLYGGCLLFPIGMLIVRVS